MFLCYFGYDNEQHIFAWLFSDSLDEIKKKEIFPKGVSILLFNDLLKFFHRNV